MPSESHLHIRLKTCLQTILELEPDMAKLALYDAFKADMHSLKHFLHHIDTMQLSEHEVQRLENATSRFLSEVGLPLHTVRATKQPRRVVQ